jgi:hypothetical protein
MGDRPPEIRAADARWSHVVAILLAACEDDDLGGDVAEYDDAGEQAP